MEFSQFCPRIDYVTCFFATTKRLSIDVESLHFPTFSAECKIEKRDGRGNLRNGHGKVMEKYCVESVGTLSNIL